jgi:AcrR family transcriptional regulator
MPGVSTGAPSRTRRARGSLSADEILDAAERIVDRDGLHSLSMPTLARELGCGVTSIYWYFRSKDDLVVALADRVEQHLYARVPPIGDGAWDDELVAYFSSYRELMHRTPVYRETFAYRTRSTFGGSAVTRSVLHRLDAGLALFVRGGLTPDQAAHAYQICATFTNGFIALEHGSVIEDPDIDVGAAVNASIAQRDLGDLPTLGQVTDFGGGMAYDDVQFRRGLRLVLAGVASAAHAGDPTLLG